MEKIIILVAMMFIFVGCSMMMDEATDISYLSHSVISSHSLDTYDVHYGDDERVYIFYDESNNIIDTVTIYTENGITWYIQ